MTEPTSSEMAKRRSRSLEIEFIVHFPNTKHVYDTIKNCVVILRIQVHFFKNRTTETIVETAAAFFGNIFRHHTWICIYIVSEIDRKFTYEFCKRCRALTWVRAIPIMIAFQIEVFNF